jgi:Pyrimidine reductase, riboflavin biosynthesis
LRASVDAVIVGANTAIVDNPRLTVRYVEGRNPIRVLIDGALRAPPYLHIFDTSAPTLVFTTMRASPEKIEELRSRCVEVHVVDGESVDPATVLQTLYKRGVRKVLLEGGGKTNWEFLKRCLVDEIILTITPYVFGNGVSLIDGEGYSTTEEAPFSLSLISIKLCECGREVVLTYKINCKK